jgi:hypothetical protein
MPWHVHVVSLCAGGSRLKVKGGFTGYALRTGEICRVMSQMKTRLKGSVVLRLLWPHYFSALAAWRCAPQSAEHRGVKRKTAPGSAWGTLPGAALGLCGCVGPSYPRPCIKEIVSRLTGISRSICISRSNSGSLAIFAAILRASSLLSCLAAERRPTHPRNRHRRAFARRCPSRQSTPPIPRQSKAGVTTATTLGL